MSDWREHNGGPQPVDDDVWVEVQYPHDDEVGRARARFWACHCRYRIINQHLIDAARLEGIRLGLWAAEKYNRRAFDLIVDALRNVDPETIAREGLTKPAPSDIPPSSSDIPQEAHND